MDSKQEFQTETVNWLDDDDYEAGLLISLKSEESEDLPLLDNQTD